MVNTFTAIDFETANTDKKSICQIGLIRVVDGKISDEIKFLVQPPEINFLPDFIGIHGITPKMVATAPTFAQIWYEIEPFIVNQNVVAHNGFNFDFLCLSETFKHYTIQQPEYTGYDTYRIFNKSLAKLCEQFSIPLNHHDALSDAKACAELFLIYQKKMAKEPMYDIMNKAFTVGLRAQYENIFEQYYPGDSNGINETNQVVNYCNSLLRELTNQGDPDAFAAFELPLGGGDRMDATVFSKRLSAIFFIEAKRLKNNQPRYQKSLVKDLLRMLNSTKRDAILKEDWKDVQNKYLICLADHWVIEEKWTNDILKWFDGFHMKQDEVPDDRFYVANHEGTFEVIYSNCLTDFKHNEKVSDEKYMMLLKVLKIN